MLFENRHDLRLGESGLAHEGFLSAILAWKPTVSNGPDYRGNVVRIMHYHVKSRHLNFSRCLS
jgi:hypothetical protein